MKKIRVFSISHSNVVTEYRKRWQALAATGAVELAGLTPAEWTQFNRRVATVRTDFDETYTLLVRQPRGSALWHHGLRNVVHYYPGLRRAIAAFRPDVVEAWEEPIAVCAAHAVAIARGIGARAIFFSAENLVERRPFPFSAIERYVLSHADGAFLMNRDVREILLRKNWRGRDVILPLGIDPCAFNADGARIRAEWSLDGIVIGYLGKLNAEKGVLDLMDAFTQLRVDRRVTLAIVGGGGLKPLVEERIRRGGFPGRVLLKEIVDHGDVPAALAAFDITVVPSRTTPGWMEQFGRVIVEAAAAGSLVLGSDSGEIPRVVADPERVFPEQNPVRLAQTLKFWIEHDDKRKQCAADFCHYVRDTYSWRSIAEKQVEFYRELMEQNERKT